MKKIPCTVAAVVCVAAGAGSAVAARPTTAASSSLSCRGAVSWQRTAALVGRVATVTGRVAGATYASSSNGSPTFLNVGHNYPNPSRFTVVIWIENRAAFGRPEVKYRGRTICVHGLVSSYAGVPEIVARTPLQITIIR